MILVTRRGEQYTCKLTTLRVLFLTEKVQCFFDLSLPAFWFILYTQCNLVNCKYKDVFFFNWIVIWYTKFVQCMEKWCSWYCFFGELIFGGRRDCLSKQHESQGAFIILMNHTPDGKFRLVFLFWIKLVVCRQTSMYSSNI